MEICFYRDNVTPLAGVWIEILYVVRYDVGSLSSLPLRECGLKYFGLKNNKRADTSLPLRECGLKYYGHYNDERWACVTPLAGVWIEIFIGYVHLLDFESLPLRECGLKSNGSDLCVCISGHSPCGSVD